MQNIYCEIKNKCMEKKNDQYNIWKIRAIFKDLLSIVFFSFSANIYPYLHIERSWRRVEYTDVQSLSIDNRSWIYESSLQPLNTISYIYVFQHFAQSFVSHLHYKINSTHFMHVYIYNREMQCEYTDNPFLQKMTMGFL